VRTENSAGKEHQDTACDDTAAASLLKISLACREKHAFRDRN
jgi:hypothetical protein